MMSIRSQSKWCCMWKKNWYVIYSNFDIITLVAVEALGPATSRVRRAERERAGRGWVLGVGYPAGPHPRGAHSVPHKLRLWTLSHTQCSVAVIWPSPKSAAQVIFFISDLPDIVLRTSWTELASLGQPPRFLPHNQHPESDPCLTTSQRPFDNQEGKIIVHWGCAKR